MKINYGKLNSPIINLALEKNVNLPLDSAISLLP